MAHLTGKDLYVAFAGTDVSGDFRTLTVNEATNTVDTTAGNDVDEGHLTTTKAVDFSLDILIETTDRAAGSALTNGAYGTLEFGPEGTASGNPKYSCAATITSVSRNLVYNDVYGINMTLMRDGAWLEHYDESGDTY